MEATVEANRKPVKGKGIDSEASRRNREDKGIQIRKDKRLDRANVERRKFKIEEDEDQKSSQSTHTRIRNLEILPKKCELLRSDDVAKQLEAAIYFRRILAADKFPPLDLVVEQKLIIPTLIQYLTRFEAPSLQIEAAWSLTNVACGEARHIACLVDNGAIPELVKVIAVTKNATLRDQALWAICNISSDDYACLRLAQFPNILVPLLQLVGLTCPTYHSAFTLEQQQPQFRQEIRQFDMPDFPSLSTMRHVAFTCSNFARLRTQLSIDEYRYIIFCFADLIQSPDEDIMKDICNSLIALCQDHPVVIPLIVEQGFVSKMRECFDLSALSEIALLVICALLRAPLPHNLVRVSALAHKSTAKPTLQHVVELLAKTDSNVCRKDVCCALSVLADVSPKYITQIVHFDGINRLCSAMQQGCAFDVKLEAGSCLCKIVLGVPFTLDAITSNQASQTLCDLLSSTDLALQVAAIHAISRLFSSALACGVFISNYVEIQDKVDLLTIHPYSEVASIAVGFERLLEKYAEAVAGSCI